MISRVLGATRPSTSSGTLCLLALVGAVASCTFSPKAPGAASVGGVGGSGTAEPGSGYRGVDPI
jgi:hypothetical protein